MKLLLLNYMVNAMWQVPAIALLAWIVSGIAPLSAARQSMLWQAFLLVAILLPLLPEDRSSFGFFSHWGPFAVRDPWQLGFSITHGITSPLDRPAPVWIVLDKAAEVRLLASFAGLSLLAGFRLTFSLFRTAKLVERTEPLNAGVFKKLAGPETAAPRPLEFGRSLEIGMPATAGWVRPLILLPAAFDRLAEDDQRAVLLHELAHVNRRDFASNLFVEILTLPLCWHPAMMFMKARTRAAREFACDAAAATQMGARPYAKHLVSAAATLARNPLASPPRLLPGLLGGANLVVRVRRLTAKQAPCATGACVRSWLAFFLSLGALGLVVFAPLYPCAPAAYRLAHYQKVAFHR